MIKAAAGFNGDTLLNGKDVTVGIAGEISFAVGVKNIILDTTALDAGTCSHVAAQYNLSKMAGAEST